MLPRPVLVVRSIVNHCLSPPNMATGADQFMPLSTDLNNQQWKLVSRLQ